MTFRKVESEKKIQLNFSGGGVNPRKFLAVTETEGVIFTKGESTLKFIEVELGVVTGLIKQFTTDKPTRVWFYTHYGESMLVKQLERQWVRKFKNSKAVIGKYAPKFLLHAEVIIAGEAVREGRTLMMRGDIVIPYIRKDGKLKFSTNIPLEYLTAKADL